MGAAFGFVSPYHLYRHNSGGTNHNHIKRRLYQYVFANLLAANIWYPEMLHGIDGGVSSSPCDVGR
jgi:hypothetical protein